jgi:HEAT repeat protein
MPPRRDLLREQLHALAELHKQPPPARDEPGYAARQALLRTALTGKSSFAAAAAADCLRDSDTELLALLAPAFERFLAEPLHSDKGCTAKTAIARALERVDSSDDTVFRRGLFYTQPEPVFGGRQDTAVELRSICALGLSRLGPPDLLGLLAELLADPERGARVGAVRALGSSGELGAAPLLRYKALVGDPDSLVLTECLGALLQLERSAALPFVQRLLTPQDEARADAAALALGQSRLPEATPLLQQYAELPPRSERRAALLALAMLREPAATEYLLGLLAEAEPRQAQLVLEALGLHRYDAALRQRVTAVVMARRSPALLQGLEKAFPPA